MNLSEDGFRLIRSFEGYHKRLEDGRCIAYRCPAGVWTIGYGCTEGVKEGMIWTAEQAENGLRREIAKHEAAVNRLVTVEINQNQFDALVSLSYNIGSGALSKSSVLKKTNAGNFTAAAQAFAAWNKGGGKVLPGLVSRRAREAALFMKPAAAPEAPFMPQNVGKSLEVSKTVAGTAAAGTGAVVSNLPVIPSPPDLSQFTAWQSAGETAAGLMNWAAGRPFLTAGLVGWVLVMAFWERLPSFGRAS